MATDESKRVMALRKKNNDRFSFVMDKSAKYLLHAQAMREGVSVAEMVRRSILARCGLENWPSPAQPHYNLMVSCTNRETALRAIEGLQLDEYVSNNSTYKLKRDDDGDDVVFNDVFLTVLLSSRKMKDEYIKALLDLLDVIEDVEAPWADGSTPPTRIKFDKKSLTIVRRLLANIDEHTIYDEPSED